MNIYVLLRIILHSLLSVVNTMALTAAAWNIAVSKSHPKVSPAALLVIVGTGAFVLLELMTWAECVMTHTPISSMRTEFALVPMLIVYQLIAATVAALESAKGQCHEPTSCVVLLVLAWIAPICLILYFLVVAAVTLNHATKDPKIWDATPLRYPWFATTTPSSPKPPPMMQRPIATSDASYDPFALPAPPFLIFGHRRQLSSWQPPALVAQQQQQSLSSSPPLPTGAASPFIPPSRPVSAYSTRSNRSIPRWARNLPALRRGLEQPFPVRTHEPVDRWKDSRRIDAPVSPSLITEFPALE